MYVVIHLFIYECIHLFILMRFKILNKTKRTLKVNKEDFIVLIEQEPKINVFTVRGKGINIR